MSVQARTPVALILGGATRVWDDLRTWRAISAGLAAETVFAVNYAGAAYPGRIHHWVTLHPDKLVTHGWVAARNGPRDEYTVWSCRKRREVDEVLGHWGKGSSGLFAVTVALHLGFRRIVLCGVPLDGQGNVDGREEWPVKDQELHRAGWRFHRGKIAGKVKSMSGWTRDMLGAPTIFWLFDGRVVV